MFLKAAKRQKDGKVHLYWSLVENVRVGFRVFQRQALYLGELNDSQHEEWRHAIGAFDEKGHALQLKLFPSDRAPAEDGDGQVVRIRMDKLSARNLRNWGEVWLGLELWNRLGLDEFWSARLEPSRKGTDWLAILKSIVLYRLTDPGSELRMHSQWMANTAIAELVGAGAFTGRDSDLQRYGYSRDKRGDCLQVVVALVLTPAGFPLAYEVHPDNTSDKGTQMAFIRKLESQYGQIGNLWLMDRDDRIEAHIFTAFMALCLLSTLRAISRAHAPGLTPRQKSPPTALREQRCSGDLRAKS